MTEDVFIVAIVFGTTTFIVLSAMIYSLIKTWIKNRNQSEISTNEWNNFVSDIEYFRQSVNKRLQNLEAILADEDPKEKEVEKSNDEIESKGQISEFNDIQDSEPGENRENSSKLDNMLKN